MKVIFRVGLLLIVFLQSFHCQVFPVIEAPVNDQVTLQCGLWCPGDAKWTLFLPTEADVAHCDTETCSLAAGYQKRFTFSGNKRSGNISLLITSVVYNDIGFYRCSCDGKTFEVKLKVFVPTVILSRERENATLPCYADTRADVKDVQWKKNGEKLLVYHDSDGTVTTGDARFFLLKESFQDGDLSLHITSVQQTDAGLYLCSIQEELQEGDPRAVLLKVEASFPEPQLRVSAVISAVVNDPVTFPFSCSGDAQWTIFSPTKAIIAGCENGSCKFEDSFQERFAFSRNDTTGNISLLIKHVVFSDVGSYRSICAAKISEVSLEVIAGNRSRWGLLPVFLVIVLVVGISAFKHGCQKSGRMHANGNLSAVSLT